MAEHPHPATVAVSAGRPPRVPGNPLSSPPTFASVRHAGVDDEYGREGNSAFSAVEEAIGALEGGTALVFSSGMAAISAVVATAVRGRPGLVLPIDGYHGTHALLADTTGLRTESVDIADTEATIDALPEQGALWIESPTNPMITIADIAALAKGVAAKDGVLVVDSTVATPLVQRPLDLGAHVVVHSATKFMGGHSDLLLGAVVTRDERLAGALKEHRTVHGAIPGVMECFLALRGIRTLDVRLQRAMANALELAQRLAAHPAIQRVHYPGLPDNPGHDVASRQMQGGYGALMSFELATAEQADAVCQAARHIVYATSLGGVETSMERRARWPGEHAPPGLIRMSVGIEHVEDIWSDLEQALAHA